MRSLFGLFGRRDRRPRSRAYSPIAATPRRYELPRPEPRRVEPVRPDYGRSDFARPDRRRAPREVNWRRRITLALTATAMCAVLAGGAWLYRSDVFRVKVIDVNGVQVADPQAIAKAAGVSGSSMLTLNLDRARQQVAKQPAVKSAAVRRDWPHGVVIDVTEHQAWGYWQAGPQRLVIDEAGRILEQSRPPAHDAPTIVEVASDAPASTAGVTTDPDTVQLVHRLRAEGVFERLGVQPTSYVFRRDRGLTVIVDNGPAAVLGDSSNYEFKVRTWQALLEQVRAGQVPLVQARAQATPGAQAQPSATAPAGQPSTASEIDLRFGRNVVLR